MISDSPYMLLVLLVVALGLWEIRHRQPRLRSWRQAAEQLGLSCEVAHPLSPPRLVGELDGLAVEVSWHRDWRQSERRPWAVVRVDLRDRLPPGTRIELESALRARRGGRAQPPDIAVGDPRFDTLVRVDGDTAWMRAVFDEPTRELVYKLLFQGRLTLTDGVLEWREPGDWYEVSNLTGLVERVAALAHRLALTRDAMPAALQEIATTDPNPGVRANALRAMLEHFPVAVAQAAARKAIDDPALAVRVLAASAMGEGGLETLEHELFERRELPFGRGTKQVVAHVAGLLEGQARVDFLHRALGPDSRHLWGSAAEVVAELGVHECADAMLANLGEVDPTHVRDEVPARCLPLALAALGDARCVPLLMGWLGQAPPSVEAAAAAALGQVGRLDAVEPLLALADDGTRPRPLRDAARRAIETIQDRHGGEQGALAIVEPVAAGGLSVVDEVDVELATADALAEDEEEAEEEAGA